MTTSIVVEDGTIVTDSNSYVSTADILEYAALRGVTIPNADDIAEIYVYKAMDYLETLLYQGSKTDVTTPQMLQWPRKCVYIEDLLIADNIIPQQLINAECELVMAIYAGFDPLVTITTTDGVKRKKFDVFEVEYKDNSPLVAILRKVDAWLAPLLLAGSNSDIHFTTQRSYG